MMIVSGLRRRGVVVKDWILGFTISRLLFALVRELGSDDVFGTAAEMAYRFLFAIFPLLLFIASALGFIGAALGFDDLFGSLMRQAGPFLPAQVGTILNQTIEKLFASRSTAVLTIGLIGTFWGAAGGVGALTKALNRAYDVEYPRPFARRQTLALVTTLALPTAGIVLFALSLAGHSLAVWLGDILNLRDGVTQALIWARWPVLVAFLFIGLSLMYHVLPNVPHRYVWSLPGSVFSTVGWLLLTRAFGLYVSNFGKYNATYGSFGAAMAFLLWLYFVSVVILIGAELNALLEPTGRKDWHISDKSPETPTSSPRPRLPARRV